MDINRLLLLQLPYDAITDLAARSPHISQIISNDTFWRDKYHRDFSLNTTSASYTKSYINNLADLSGCASVSERVKMCIRRGWINTAVRVIAINKITKLQLFDLLLYAMDPRYDQLIVIQYVLNTRRITPRDVNYYLTNRYAKLPLLSYDTTKYLLSRGVRVPCYVLEDAIRRGTVEQVKLLANLPTRAVIDRDTVRLLAEARNDARINRVLVKFKLV